ncbi:alanine racemase [Neisseriaceae bacterium TC5R-5]|nr:alanine racemase [Neisseriaceae bacterium TC5R-5]
MRPLVATIRTDNLRHNYQQAKRLHGGKVLAVLKANAYGHHAVPCAQALQDIADGFAVACLEEAIQLRDAGIELPILLLEGVFEAAELQEVEQYDLWQVVQSELQLQMIEAATPAKPYQVWLMLDSRMHREGFLPEDYSMAWRRLQASGKVASIVKTTHFARADEPGEQMTQRQIELFDYTVRGLPGEVSLANSAAILCHLAARRDWGRVGILLYGATPLANCLELGSALRPVMRLTTRVFAVRELAAGEPIGYGDDFVTSRPTRVGLIACGYADGYPRSIVGGCAVQIHGQRARIIGRLSMDMMTVDLTDLPSAGIGSEVELWGDDVAVSEVAACAGTISYELLCNVKRAHFRFE